MNLKSILPVVFWAIGSQAYAIDCSQLRPSPPQKADTTFVTKLNAVIEGLFKKLVGVKTDVDVKYSSVYTDLLKDYPNPDKLYIWGRTLYLQCLLFDDSDMTSKEKSDQLSDLSVKATSAPPAVQATANPTNATTVTGNKNNTQINSNNNKVEIH